jgi:hypothetical protein
VGWFGRESSLLLAWDIADNPTEDRPRGQAQKGRRMFMCCYHQLRTGLPRPPGPPRLYVTLYTREWDRADITDFKTR